MPVAPSTTATATSFASVGFCRPSSSTRTEAPAARAAAAPAIRSLATKVGATRASRRGLVAGLCGLVIVRIDAQDAACRLRPAIAARQEGRFVSALQQQPGDGQRGRGLAGATRDEIADAYHGDPQLLSGPLHAPRRRRAIEVAEGREQSGRESPVLMPPEGRRLAQHQASRSGPALAGKGRSQA